MKRTALLMCGVALVLGNMAFGAENAAKPAEGKKPPALTTEQRHKMADLHEKMATCLRSDRPMSDCHHEMMKGCEDAMGKDACPMMGGRMGHGMHHRGMGMGKDEAGEGKE